MHSQTVRLNDTEVAALRSLAAKNSTTISASIRSLILASMAEAVEPVPDLKERLEQLEVHASKPPSPATESNFSSNEDLQAALAEIAKHKVVFSKLLTILMMVLPLDKKQLARDAAEILDLKL